jgi:hypothetical protein
MRYRYYDSTTARFLSRDPVRQMDPQAINPYQYVSANPVSNVDPMGLKGSIGGLSTGAPIPPFSIYGLPNITNPLITVANFKSANLLHQAANIDAQVNKILYLFNQAKGIEEGEKGVKGFQAGREAVNAMENVKNIPALDEASKTLKNAGKALKVVGAVTQVATITLEAVQYSNQINEANGEYDRRETQVNNIFYAKLARLKSQYAAGTINVDQYRIRQKLALLELQNFQWEGHSALETDLYIGGLGFLEHALATFTPLPPGAIDATSKAIAGVPAGPRCPAPAGR